MHFVLVKLNGHRGRRYVGHSSLSYYLSLNSFILLYLLNYCLQQSSAFKILKTRLKAVPSFSCSSEYYNSNGKHDPQFGTNILEDGQTKQETTAKQEPDFTSTVQLFNSVQTKHRALANDQRQSRKIPASLPKVSVSIHFTQLL